MKALRLLREAAVVAYPAPENGPSFARSIVASWLDRGQREIPIPIPMRPEHPPAAVYDDAADRLMAEVERGCDVAVLCQGDPFFYGSFSHLFVRLATRCRVEIVPGVSSLNACAAAAGSPLLAYDETLTVIPATLDDHEFCRRVAQADAAAIVKLGRHLPRVRAMLMRLGRPAARAICRAGEPSERFRPAARPSSIATMQHLISRWR